MRLRKSRVSSLSSSYSSAAASSVSPSSSSLSSITAHSLASSTGSSSSAPPNSTCASPSSAARCKGLDLLVKAIHQVTAGSVVGVPYVQRRVLIRRRRRALIMAELFRAEEGERGESKNSMPKRQRRILELPSKFKNSVLLQPWKSQSRRQRPVKIGFEMGS